jgi:hypothetical protein
MKTQTRQWTLLVAGFAGISVWLYATYFSSGRAVSGPSRMHTTRTRAEALLRGLETFERDFGNYPTGNNVSIVNALVRADPKKRSYLQTDGRSPSAINEQTQLVDAWGIPFQVDFQGTNSPMVRSAGRNKVFGDADDLNFSHSEPVKP